MKQPLSYLLRCLLIALALTETCLLDGVAQDLQNRPLPPGPTPVGTRIERGSIPTPVLRRQAQFVQALAPEQAMHYTLILLPPRRAERWRSWRPRSRIRGRPVPHRPAAPGCFCSSSR